MVCPRPYTHDPNPTAVPIKEAIKETFRVFMVHPHGSSSILIRQNPRFVPSRFRYYSATLRIVGERLHPNLLCKNFHVDEPRKISQHVAAVQLVPRSVEVLALLLAGN